MLGKFLLFILLLSLIKIVYAANDTLIVSNGDVLVGEIKSMDRGVLLMETDYSDSDFNIEWEKVVEFHSNRNYIIILSEGERYYGKIHSDPADGKKLMVYIHHTDAEREWAYDRDSHIGRLNKGLDETNEKGWVLVDMKNDWKVIYPFELNN